MDLEDRIDQAQVEVPEKADSSDLEVELKDSKPLTPLQEINYSLPGEHFIDYTSVNIEELWYGTRNSTTTFELEDEYWTTPAVQDVEEEMLTETEAVDSMMQVQYEAAANTLGTVSFEERRRLDFYILFNPAIFRAWESLYAVTREVNYAPPR